MSARLSHGAYAYLPPRCLMHARLPPTSTTRCSVAIHHSHTAYSAPHLSQSSRWVHIERVARRHACFTDCEADVKSISTLERAVSGLM